MTSTFKVHPGISFNWSCPQSFSQLQNFAKVGTYRLASYLTDPLCSLRQNIIKFQVVDSLPPHPTFQAMVLSRKDLLLSKNFTEKELHAMTATAEKCALTVSILLYVLFVPLALGGIFLRFAISRIEKERFIHFQSNAQEKQRDGKALTLVHWNWCGIKAGYDTGEGGQVPLKEPFLENRQTRLQKIIEKLSSLDADMVSGNESFDIQDAEYIAYALKEKYSHFVFNMGGKAVGPNSGLFFASKFAIDSISFKSFPKDILVGGAKFAEKGVAKIGICDQKGEIADVFLTHLQHSEEPEGNVPLHPAFLEEKKARKEELSFLKQEMSQSGKKTAILAGDLNMDDQEMQEADLEFYKQFAKTVSYNPLQNEVIYTWLGDQWYTSFTNQRSFLFGENKEKRKPSGGVNLDHIMVRKDGEVTSPTIETTLHFTGYDPKLLSRDSLSDHQILQAKITLNPSG